MQIKSLTNVHFDTIFKAFNRAFADYELQLNAEQLQIMLKRRGFMSELSFAAFENEEIVSFTLNGIGVFNDISTAYDTGTGTCKEYRGQGLATKIFEHSIPYLKEAGITQYLLEVLQHNTKAVSVYRNLGFEVTREFHYFEQQNNAIHTKTKSSDMVSEIKNITLGACQSVSTFWDFYPSWQNSFESIQRCAEDFIYLGAFVGDKLVGCAIFEPVSGDLTQIAVMSAYRRKGIGANLLKELFKQNKNNALKVINTDITCDSITHFLKAKNLELRGMQFEMKKVL